MSNRVSFITLIQSRKTSRGLLAAMALLVMLMPTNYRAGTQTSHPHAFFQEMIDLVVGHTHQHDGSLGTDHHHDHEHTDGSSHSHDHAHDEATPASSTASRGAPDLPGVSELTPSAEKANAILMLAALLGVIGTAAWRRRDLWSPGQVLQAIVLLVEAPPPRGVS